MPDNFVLQQTRRNFRLISCYLLTAFFATLCLTANAQNYAASNTAALTKKQNTGALFIENKGQFHNQNNVPNTEVKYLLHTPGLNIQLKANSFSYDAYKTTKLNIGDQKDLFVSTLSFHRVDIELIGAHSNPQIIAENPAADHVNYFNNSINGGVQKAKQFGKITYKNIYPGIDLEFVAGASNEPKYNFIVRPGADISKIRLKYKGAHSANLENGKINLVLAHGNMTESIPASFEKESGKVVSVDYVQIAENTFGFAAKKHTASSTLIIDPLPDLHWGTYFGEESEGRSCWTDAVGNNYLAGVTTVSGYATNGTHQQNVNGDFDVFVAKFDSDGNRIWSTYFGGKDVEDTKYSSGATDINEEVYLAGTTVSSSDIATGKAHQTSNAGGSDAFLAKFDKDGVIIWSTYYGGSDDEEGASTAVDGAGKYVYLAGSTTSAKSGIVTKGAHQTGHGGSYDAFLVQFDASGARQWGTYYGGSDDDFGYSCTIDLNNNVFLAGTTRSSSNIASGKASHQYTHGGDFDGFLVKFSSSGTRSWSTYYGGADTDYGWACTVDLSGNVFLAGGTYDGGKGDFATKGAHQSSPGGGKCDAYIVAFNGSGSRQWGTWYGGDGFDMAYACNVNKNGNVTIAGETGSTNDIASQGAYRDAQLSSRDAFAAKFDKAGTRLWGTYYGGKEEDVAYGCVDDNDGNLFIAGFSMSSSDIATPKSFQETLTGSVNAMHIKLFDCDMYAYKVKGLATVCDNAKETYSTIAKKGHTYSWKISGGTITSGQGTEKVDVAWGAAGKGQLTLSDEVDATKCKIDIVTDVVITALPTPSITGTDTACDGITETYTTPATKGNSYIWQVTGGTISSGQNSNTVTITWKAGKGTVMVTDSVDLSGCKATTPAYNVLIESTPTPAVKGVNTLCEGTTETYSTAGTKGNSYTWTITGGTITSGQNTEQVTVEWTTAGNGTLTVLDSVDATGCKAEAKYSITVNAMPKPSITGLTSACEKTKMTYSTPYTLGNAYVWTVSGGTVTAQNAGGSQITVEWGSTGSGSIAVLDSTILTGCKASTKPSSVTINATPTPSVTGLGIACDKTTKTYSTTGTTGNSYIWTVVGGIIKSGQGTNSVDVEWNTGNGSVSVIDSVDATGCKAESKKTVVVNANPKTVITGPAAACEGAVFKYSGPQTNSHCVWTVNGGTYVQVGTGSEITVTWGSAGAGDLTVTETDAVTNCATTTQAYSVKINAMPKPQFSGSATVCEKSSENYSTPAGNGSAYKWTVVGGTITTGQGTDKITVQWVTPGTGSVSVLDSITASGCKATASSNIQVNDLPVPAVSGPQTTCEKATATYDTKGGAGRTYNWVVTGGTISSGQNTNSIEVDWSAAGNGSITLEEEITATGCKASTKAFSVTVNALPVPAVSGVDSICEKNKSTYITSFLSGHTYVWTVNGGTITSGQNTNTVEVDWTTSGQGTLNVEETVTATGCKATSNTQNVEVIAAPLSVSVSGPANSIQSTTVTYSVTSENGVNYNWTVTGGTIASGQGTNSIDVTWGTGLTGTVKVDINRHDCGTDADLAVTLKGAGVSKVSDNTFTAYPNPTEGIVVLTSTTGPMNESVISLSDMTGRKIEIPVTVASANEARIDMTQLTPAVYFISFTTDGKTQVIKIVKNN